MSRGKELAKNTIIVAVGKISTQFISFFLLPLYTAVLSTQEYGTVELFNTCVALLLPVFTVQIEQGVFRYLIDVRDSEEGKRSVVSSALLFVIFQCVLWFVLFLLIQPMIHIEYKIFIALNMVGNAFAMVLQQVARGFGDNVSYSIGSFVTASLTIVFNVLLLVAIKMGAAGMLLAILIGNVSCCIYLFFRLKIYSYFSVRMFNRQLLKDLLHYSLPLVPSAISWWLVNASDRFIVTYQLGLGDNGILSVAHKFPSVYAAMYNILNITWVESATMYMKKEGGREFFSNMMNILMKLLVCAFLGIVAIMPFAFPYLVNEQYQAAYNQIPIHMLASVMNAVVGLYSVVYTVNLATKEIAKTTILAGIINVAVHVLLIRYIGLYAAGISSVIAYLVMVVYRYIDSRKLYRFRLDFKFLGSAVAVMLVIFAAYYYGSIILQAAALLLTVIYSVWVNRTVLKDAVKMIGESRFFQSRKKG